jgi:hypothetical protein
MLKIAYGYRVQGEQDPIVKTVELAMENFAEVFGKLDGYMVDYFPLCKHQHFSLGSVLLTNGLVKVLPDWFPGAGFKIAAKKYAQTFQSMAQLPFDYIKTSIVGL